MISNELFVFHHLIFCPVLRPRSTIPLPFVSSACQFPVLPVVFRCHSLTLHVEVIIVLIPYHLVKYATRRSSISSASPKPSTPSNGSLGTNASDRSCSVVLSRAMKR
ncbi:hypothetical protein V2G26_017893 [Clonostachys chloroleuca]